MSVARSHALARVATVLLLILPQLLLAQPTELFISEYTEGSGFNKAVEIYNGTGADVDLSTFKIELFANGSPTATGTLTLSGTLADGDVFVVAEDSADPALAGLADLLVNAGAINWNGDDAVRLVNGAAPIDVIGQIGVDPASGQWGTGDASTADNTIRRLPTVCAGDPDGSDAFDPAAEWEGFPNNTFIGFGSHTISCGPATPTLAVTDEQLVEGNAGAASIGFTVTLNVDATAEFTVDWHLVDGTATLANGDYVAGSGTLTFTGGLAGQQVVDVTINGDTTFEDDETFTLVLDNPQGAAVETASAIGTGTILNDDATIAEIFTIQGAGTSSPFAGSIVRSENNIVTAVGPDGFAMQTPDLRDDGNLQTSNGIYVYTGSAAACDATATPVAVGDLVHVEGTVVEYFGLTEYSVADGPLVVTCAASGQGLPTAVVFERDPGGDVPSLDPAALYCGDVGGAQNNFECLEGMLVSIPAGIVTKGNQRFGGDDYGPVHIGPHGVRALREPGVRFGNTTDAGNLAAGSWDGNPEILEMDADRLGAVPAGTELVGGAEFSATGVIAYSFSDYEFWPATLAVDQASNRLPRPVRARADDAELSIASFNVLRLCNTEDDQPLYTCADIGDPPREPTQEELDAQIAGLGTYIREVLNAPDVIGVQEVETQAVLEELADWINTPGDLEYQAYLVDGNDGGGIDNGYLVNTARVSVLGVTQLQGATIWFDPEDGGAPSPLHDRPPLLLEAALATAAGGKPLRFAVMNNHAKARSKVDDGGTASERDRAKRYLQGLAIAQAVQDYQSDSANTGVPLLLVGDYNDYQFSDGYVHITGLASGTYDDAANGCNIVLGDTTLEDCELDGPNPVDPPLLNLVDVIGDLDPNAAYSYLFTENFGDIQGQARDVPTVQVLDHVMASAAIEPLLADVAYGRANLDASLQGLADRTGPDGAGGTQPSLAIGSSDHDGLVAFFDTDCSANPAGDTDADGVCDLVDNCPATANAGQDDNDADLAGDACDADDDNDGEQDDADNCPFDANADQSDIDADGLGDACDEDDDSDGVADLVDNCPVHVNPGQEDRDADGEGDACDASHIAEAADDAFTVDEDSASNPLAVLQNDIDVEGDSFEVTGAGDAAHGTVVAGATSVDYTPDAGYCGADSFDYAITGGDTATVAITVTCVDDPPVAVDDAVSLRFDDGEVAVDVLANDTDVDAGPMEVIAVSQAAAGTVAFTASGASYAPQGGYCGADSFTYTITGGSIATVQVTVLCEGVFSDGFETD